MSNQTTDLSDYPTLSIYEVAETWASDTNKPVIRLLHQIAAAIIAGSLKLEIDDTWRLFSHKEREVKYKESLASRWGCYTFPQQQVAAIYNKNIYKPWTIEESPCIDHLRIPPEAKHEPRGLKAALYEEGITINREHFRAWCKSAGYELPRFWFGSEADTHTPPPIAAPANNQNQRTDALTALIRRLITEGTHNETESVWLALLKEQGKPGSCIISTSETEEGPVIRWRTSSGIFKNLNNKALAGRLKRFKKSNPNLP